MTQEPKGERSPGMKLLFAALVGATLALPLLMVYALVWDRQSQSQTAQASITRGWGGPQIMAGPVMVIPYRDTQLELVETPSGRSERTVEIERELFVSPLEHAARTRLAPEIRRKSIYASVLYEAQTHGTARFALPADLARYGVSFDRLQFDRAELRFGVSDARGLRSGSRVSMDGRPLPLQPGKGLGATGGAGFFSFVAWNGVAPLSVTYDYGLRGSRSLSLVPRGGNTRWEVGSSWPHPSFAGSFLPERKRISDRGFNASFAVPNLALGLAPVLRGDPGPPMPTSLEGPEPIASTATDRTAPSGYIGPSLAATIDLVEPVDLYSRVDRAVKYGFLFIGFTFLAFLMFDIVGGARVAVAEYLLSGAGLVLFFVLLLALAEVVGFAPAYLLASLAIIGLLTAYSAAVLASWRRARFIGALLVGLYALLFVLLSLETWSLLIGALLLFVALAGVMYATRGIDWASVGRPAKVDSGGAVPA